MLPLNRSILTVVIFLCVTNTWAITISCSSLCNLELQFAIFFVRKIEFQSGQKFEWVYQIRNQKLLKFKTFLQIYLRFYHFFVVPVIFFFKNIFPV